MTGCQASHDCTAYLNGKTYRCSLGAAGVSENKKEGDEKTPVGDFPLRKVFYRPDRLAKHELQTGLPSQAMSQSSAWCDDIHSPFYNQFVKLPFTPSHEALWRDDHVYDIVVVVGYNDHPIIKEKGSAIFLHIAREGYTPTAGCVAFSKNDLLAILKQLGPKAHVTVDENRHVFFAT